MSGLKWLRVLLAVAMLVAGPLSPIALAQQLEQPKEVAKEPDASDLAAGLSNVLYVPGKFVVCTAGSVLGVATMALTFGTRYDDAARFIKGACGGSWVITAEDMRRALKDDPSGQ